MMSPLTRLSILCAVINANDIGRTGVVKHQEAAQLHAARPRTGCHKHILTGGNLKLHSCRSGLQAALAVS